MKPVRWTAIAPALLIACALTSPSAAGAQIGGGQPIPAPDRLVRASAAAVEIPAGGTATARVALTIAPGWHINANPPSPDYMIATEVKVAPASGVSAGTPRYPAAKQLKVAFDQSTLSAWDGEATVELPLAAAADARPGTVELVGTIAFQACNDQVCLAPAEVEFRLPVAVTASTGAPSPPSPSPTPSGGFATAPPAPGAKGAALDNPLARALERGGWAAYLALFLVGLALNLTPCVYPMLGVTVSIFGARGASAADSTGGGQASARALPAFGLAALYVLGIATMYSTLGLVAASTGGLFGGFLQSKAVLVVIGALLAAMSLAMFGLYQLQAPAWLLARLGGSGATSAAGIFASGLLVGVFAAPCIGPPVVALLAVVAARGDPWFGFRSFFTLSLGLGLPYLVLGTFSGLLRRLPRSGEWMVWVERLFGVILLSIGLFYGALAIAPRLAGWVMPLALVLGGLYLGLIQNRAATRPAFRWITRAAGLLAAAAGIALVATTPSRGIEFKPFAPEDMKNALGDGRPVMIEFSADWCVPCHELERSTFSDRRVVAAAASFEAFKVDLTRYNSAEADRWRKQYAIRGVPTVLFLAPDGTEVRGARVEGFIPPEDFLQLMRLASGARSAAERPAGGS